MQDAARRAHELGCEDLNLELIFRMLQLADRLNAPPSTYVGYILMGSTRVLAIEHIQQTLPAWKLGTDPTGADRLLTQRILYNLLDEFKHVDEMRQALIGERLFCYDTMLSIIDGRLSSLTFTSLQNGPPTKTEHLIQSTCISPVFIADLNDVLDSFGRLLEDRGAFIHWKTLQSRLDQSFGHRIEFSGAWSRRPRDKLQYWLGDQLVDGINHFGGTHIGFLSRCRLSAAAIAIRLRQIDHGQRPETLDALVPAYLPSIPLDLFGPVGQPIRYRPEGVIPEINPASPYSYSSPSSGGQMANPLDVFVTPKAMPLVYSVGADGADNGGKWMLEHDGSIKHELQRSGLPPGYDHVFLLEALQPPVKKATTAPTDTSEGDADSPGSPGLDHQGRVPGGEGDAQHEEGEEHRS